MTKLTRHFVPVIAILLSFAILLFSCQKELSQETSGIITPPIENQASIEGRVIDETGMPVFGALVKAGINNTSTDNNGFFKFTNASFTTSETFVTVSKGGYFTGSRTFFSRDNSNNFLKVQLLRKTISARIPATSGGDVEVSSGRGTVSFQPNSFVTANGTLYTGTVLVATQYLDPSKPSISDQMPGDLRGTSTAGNVVGLKSYGMVAVELTDETGQLLQIKSGSNASLSVNIPASKMTTAPSTIPLWYFNDSTGLWKQEGSAIKNGDTYEGTVTHFTFWNCDDPFEYVKIKAHIVSNSGSAVAGAKVQITDVSGYTAYDYTDNNGYVDGFVPKNQNLTIAVLNACGQVVYTSNIGPFNAETNLGNIIVTQNTSTISGTAVNCNGGPVTNGYVQILLNGATEFAGISNGTFSLTFINCQGSTSAQLIAVDNITLKQGAPVTINITGPSVNAGQLTACGVSSATFFNFSINGVDMSANTPEFYRYGWKEVYDSISLDADYGYAAFDSIISKFVYVAFSHPSNHIFTVPYSVNSGLEIAYSGLNGTSEEYSLEPLNPNTLPLNFTIYGGLGQFIEANFNGQVKRVKIDSTGMFFPADTVNATFNFRVRHVSSPF